MLMRKQALSGMVAQKLGQARNLGKSYMHATYHEIIRYFSFKAHNGLLLLGTHLQHSHYVGLNSLSCWLGFRAILGATLKPIMVPIGLLLLPNGVGNPARRMWKKMVCGLKMSGPK